MDVLSNILYFSVYLKHCLLSQKRSENKRLRVFFFCVCVAFVFLPFSGNKIVQSSGGMWIVFLSWNFSLNAEFSSSNFEFHSCTHCAIMLTLET